MSNYQREHSKAVRDKARKRRVSGQRNRRREANRAAKHVRRNARPKSSPTLAEDGGVDWT